MLALRYWALDTGPKAQGVGDRPDRSEPGTSDGQTIRNRRPGILGEARRERLVKLLLSDRRRCSTWTWMQPWP